MKQKKRSKLKSKLTEVIACPACKGPLVDKSMKLFCHSCQKNYSLQDGIFRASDNKYYWGEINQEQMQRLLDDARKVGWIKALESSQKYFLSSGFKSITRANRADWRFNLPLDRNIRVLAVGSGWGQIPFLLAESYAEVWSLEYIRERIEWQQIRKEQEGIDNLFLVQSNVTCMPFISETFDLVSMNGVLEWVGLANAEKKVRDIQLEVLSNARQLLKPGGYLYIGIENRIGFSMFLGEIDHSGKWFTSLMPRWLANYFVRNFKKNSYRTDEGQNDYRTFTYSPPGYQKLLKEAGFSNIKFYWVQPSYNNPMSFAPINDSRKIDFYYKQIIPQNLIKWLAKQVFRLLIRCGFMNLFSSHLLIYAQKGK